MSAELTKLQEEELALRNKLTMRGSPRAAIVRKETLKKLKKLQKQAKSSPSSQEGDEQTSGHHHVTWGRSTGHKILQECTLKADPELFLASKHSEFWKRDKPWNYHLKKLQNLENPLSRRVAAWEDLAEQPEEYEFSEHLTDAWRIKRKSSKESEKFAIYGDEAMFRDLPGLSEQMDPLKFIETTYKLSDGKPSPYEPDHASSIVLYLSEAAPNRVLGAVVYDCLGQARVDVNFQHHLMDHGEYMILSGHWHILSVGSHAHESGLENHYDYRFCPWIWQAIPIEFNVLPLIPVGI